MSWGRGEESTASSQAVAPGLNALHAMCRDVYPEQINPLTVTAVIKYWLGGPDPLDYISMFANSGCPELNIPPHWHYISLGLSDLHGDGRLHPRGGPGRVSGFGFELTFRLVREPNETTPPTWPANVLQQLAKYVFNSGNMLLPGDHVSWHSPLDATDGNRSESRITQILMAKDPCLPSSILTPLGEVTFVQVTGVTSEELQAAQHWNGLGVINLLKSTKSCGPWLVTDMRRRHSVMEEDPTIAEKIRSGIEREGSNLSGVSAKCWWVQMGGDRSTETYRERKEDSDEEKEGGEDAEENPRIKTEILSSSSCDGDEDNTTLVADRPVNPVPGLHLTFNLEAGSLLPLAIKGRILHGRHFTFKSILSHSAVTMVASSVTGTLTSKEQPYMVQGPWLQVLVPDDLADSMAKEFEVLNNPQQLQLPKTFSWPEHKLLITIVND